MSARQVERALTLLAAGRCSLVEDRDGAFSLRRGSDRRKRPLLRLSAEDVRALEGEGALTRGDADDMVLTRAGAARVRRDGASDGEAYLAQHAVLIDRSVMRSGGGTQRVRGVDGDAPLRRLASLKSPTGEPFLSDAELAAAHRLRAAWEVAQIGQVRGSDWTAAPIGGSARGASNAQERAMARRCDAQRVVGLALGALADPLRRVVERTCLYDAGFDALEREEGWPARSAKLALKLGLAQLAAALR